MGFRFRRTIRILPGLRLNLSKGGISTSIGGPGATLNVGRTGTRATVGLPGTGLSYSRKLGTAASAAPPTTGVATRPSTRLLWIIAVLVVIVAVAVMTA